MAVQPKLFSRIGLWLLVGVCVSAAVPACVSAQDAPRADAPQRETAPAEPAELVKSAALTPAPISVAEQITRLQRMISADEKQLADLTAELNNPENEYRKAEAGFRRADERLMGTRAEVAKLKESGETDGLAKLEQTLADHEQSWQLQRKRFDLAIQTRKTVQEQVVAIEAKLTQSRAALSRLEGTNTPAAVTPTTPAAPAAPEPSAAAGAASAMPSQATPAAAAPVAPVVAPEAPAAPEAKPAPAPAAPATPTLPGIGGLIAPVLSSQTNVNSGDRSSPDATSQRNRREVAAAEEVAKEKQRVAEEALTNAKSVTERLATLDKDIAIEQSLLAAAREKEKLVEEARELLQNRYHRKVLDDGGREEMQEARDKLEEASTHLANAHAAVLAHIDRLQELQADRADLHREELAALESARLRQDELLKAQERVSELKNPYAPHNLVQWLLDHGLRIAIILITMIVLKAFIRISMRRAVDLMMQRGFRGTYEESEDRAKTLAGVFQNAASTTVIAGGTLMLFEEVGIAVAPLMGGAAVVGLAVAFGAQNLIRDYFYGFVILLENQYKINDILRIGPITGQVERITLRMTVLRDLEGAVHFIPNGKIDCVTNLTHGWSRAMFEIKVGFYEDTDRISDLLVKIASELRREPQFGKLILDDAEMLGVDAITDSSATIKFLIKTRPLKQWMVKREMLRRIRVEFARQGIGLAIPRHVLHMQNEELTHLLGGSNQAHDGRAA